MKKFLSLALIFVAFAYAAADRPERDKATMKEYPNPFWDQIQKSADEFVKKSEDDKLKFKMEFDGYELPKSTDDFMTVWHNNPVPQGWTGTCWCFDGTSFLESEVYRINRKEIKISEMHTVYWEYVEKARRYVQERGQSAFAEGSQQNAVVRMWGKYGCVPAKDYTGLKEGQTYHDHRALFREMNTYLKSVKARNEWNEELVLSTIRSILNHYLGTPPETVEWKGKKYTPREFCDNVCKLDLGNYVNFMSLMEKPFNTQAEYKVTDNWWRCDKYYNLTLDDYMKAFRGAIDQGYSVAIGGDVSETGYNSHSEVAIVPSFDIPADYIDGYARQFRFSNRTTTDDHGIHVVGHAEINGENWYLIKDSGSGSRNGDNKGYYFYHEDYIKLKIMNFMVHKDAVKDILSNLK